MKTAPKWGRFHLRLWD